MFWTLLCERNRVVFENGVTSAQRIKANFLSNLWTWENLYSVDKMNYFLDFLTWLGEGRVLGSVFGLVDFLQLFSCCCFCLSPSGSLLYTSNILLGTSWFFLIFITFTFY